MTGGNDIGNASFVSLFRRYNIYFDRIYLIHTDFMSDSLFDIIFTIGTVLISN